MDYLFVSNSVLTILGPLNAKQELKINIHKLASLLLELVNKLLLSNVCVLWGGDKMLVQINIEFNL